MRSAVVAALALLASAAPVVAQPSVGGVAGTIANNSSVNVSGTGFGSKAAAAPVKFDDFSAGTVGQNLNTGTPTVGSNWTITRNGVGTAGVYPTYETGQLRHARNTRSARANFTWSSGSNYTYLSSFGMTDANFTGGIYIDTWMYLEYGGTDGVDYSRNHKPIRIHANDEGFPNSYIGYWNPNNAAGSVLDQDSLENTSYANKTSTWSDDANDYENHWTHFQWYQRQSTVNTADGISWLKVNGAVVVNRTNVVSRDTSTNGNNAWDQVLFGNYMGHDACCGGTPPEQGPAFNFNGYSSWSDTYVDITPARVEIGNTSSYSTASHTEVCVPTAWSGTSITCTFKQGSFADGASIYFFVCDSSNVCSTGNGPYTIGQDGGSGTTTHRRPFRKGSPQ